MKTLLTVLCLLVLGSSLANADAPCLPYISVTPLLGDPDNPSSQVAFLAPGSTTGNTLTVSIRNCSNLPIPGAVVTVVFDSAVKTCVTSVHTATTDQEGLCTITLTGGGCVVDGFHGMCVIKANGFEIRNLRNVRSPDNGSHQGSAPDGRVNVTDLAYFGDEFKGVVPAGCHDYDNNTLVNTTDLGYFGNAYSLGLSCDLNP